MDRGVLERLLLKTLTHIIITPLERSVCCAGLVYRDLQPSVSVMTQSSAQRRWAASSLHINRSEGRTERGETKERRMETKASVSCWHPRGLWREGEKVEEGNKRKGGGGRRREIKRPVGREYNGSFVAGCLSCDGCSSECWDTGSPVRKNERDESATGHSHSRPRKQCDPEIFSLPWAWWFWVSHS